MNVSALLDASSDLAQVFRMYRQDRPDCSLPYAGNDADDDGDDDADARAKYLLATSDKEPFLAQPYAPKMLRYKHTKMPNKTVEGLIFYFRPQVKEFSDLLERTCEKYGYVNDELDRSYDELKGPVLRLALEQAAKEIAVVLESELAQGNTKQRIQDALTTAADSNGGASEDADHNCCNRPVWLNGVRIKPDYVLHAAVLDLLGKTVSRVLPTHGPLFRTPTDSYTRNEVIYFLCLFPGCFTRKRRTQSYRMAEVGCANPRYVHYKNLVVGKVVFTTISAPGKKNDQVQKQSRKTVAYTFRLPFEGGDVYVGHFTAFFRFVFPVDATNEDDDEADYERDRVNHQLAEVEWLPMVDTEVIKYDLNKHKNTLGTERSRTRRSIRKRYVKSSIEYIYVPTSGEEEVLPVADAPDRQNTIMSAKNRAISPCTYIKTKASESNLKQSVRDRPGDVYFVFSKAQV